MHKASAERREIEGTENQMNAENKKKKWMLYVCLLSIPLKDTEGLDNK